MNKHAIFHQAKSTMAYALEDKSLVIILQTAKGDFDKVELIYGDPFIWYENHWKNKPFFLMEKRFTTELFDYFYAVVKTDYHRCKYAFLLHDQNIKYLYGTREFYEISSLNDPKLFNLFNYFNFPYVNNIDNYQNPSWVKDTIWYQIFPDRFNRSIHSSKDKVLPWGSVTEGIKNNMHFGGDLKGVKEKLPYLKDLGINGIYFTPIFVSPTAHKYDTTDYFKVDELFGTNDDFKELVDEAHRLGIKIMLDAVFNHCGWFHPYFQDVVKNGKNSSYYDCFYVKDPNKPLFSFKLKNNFPQHAKIEDINYETFAFATSMPKWNTENPIARKHLLEVAAYWIKNYDIDGWRLDVSNEVSHDFWREFTKTVKDIKKDIFILGENWDISTPWLGPDQFHAVMNYELLFPMWQFFALDKKEPKIYAKEFANIISKIFIIYPIPILESTFNLVGSHDTTRILFKCNNNLDLVKLPFIFMFTFPGAPNIYYGDEIGMTGDHDPDNRRCMIWDEENQNLEFQAFIKKLITLRNQYPEMKSTNLRFIDSCEKQNYLIYTKAESLFIILNNSKQDSIIPNPILGEYLDLFTDERVVLGETILLKPYEFKIYKKIGNVI